MAFKKLATVSLTDMFTEEIKRMILSDELHAGQAMPPERQMAEEMGVSLAVVHAGITRLTALGFLRVIPRQGIFVEDYLRTGDMNTMMAIVDFSGRGLDRDAFDLLTTFRRSCEVLITKRACEHRTDEDLQRLEALLRRTEDPAEKTSLPELGFEFHHEIALSAGNPYYSMVLQTFRPVYVFFYKQAFRTTASAGDITGQLWNILDALREQDAEKAETIINANIDHWVTTFEKSEKFKRSRT